MDAFEKEYHLQMLAWVSQLVFYQVLNAVTDAVCVFKQLKRMFD